MESTNKMTYIALDTETTGLPSKRTKDFTQLPVFDSCRVVSVAVVLYDENDKEINNFQSSDKPILFQIIEMPLQISQKNHILKTYTSLVTSRYPEKKLNAWFDSLMTLPFGKFKGINLTSITGPKVKTFLSGLHTTMENVVHGHDEAKRQIIQMMGQQIRNPKSKGNMLGIWGPPGNGKCFALDTPILMHNGKFKKVQEVKIGDIVMGDDSRPRNVLSLGSGKDEMYEVVPVKGESYTVNSEHILCLKQSGLDIVKKKKDKFKVQYFNKKTYNFHTKTFEDKNEAMKYLNELKTNEIDDVIEITIKDYLKLSNHVKSKLKGYKTGVDFEKNDVLFDPYIIGVWLGDGASATTKITSQDASILAYLRTKLKEYNLNLNFISKYDYNIACDTNQNTRQSMNTFKNALKHYNLLNNKHIPNDYKINSRDIRLKVLAGLIDTDGYYNDKMKNFEIIQKSKQLSDDIIYLARSLGFAAYQYKVNKSCMYKGEKKMGTYYRLQIYGDNLSDIPTLCRRKHTDANTDMSVRQKNHLVYGIKVVSKGEGNYYGFTLDGNNRFLLGDFSVTHNTTLIKEGIAKAMDKPFIFISLGGATDASFLEGHSYTYEGSIYGRIVNGLITSKCMDPIIYFDELDKISRTPKGDEISNILIHLTDPVQNSHYRDKYFHGIDIDLSRATMIFSFNDPSNVNPVLLDRITTVETKYLMTSQKINIANKYLIPEILKEMGLAGSDIVIDEDIIKSLISNYTHEGGVRKLKSLLYNIIREVNLAALIKGSIGSDKIKFPFRITTDHLKVLLKHKNEIDPEKIHLCDKLGIINGLYATSMGIGGILPIQTVWVPSPTPLTLKATGHLEKVIRESTEVACSLAWNYLTEEVKTKYLMEWKDRPMGFHIHCPDGAVPKDGPSAGAALTLSLYSLLMNRKIRHDLAMTGEINLEGNVTAIGGLEEKLEGAKRAGVKLVLFPKENLKHLEKIKERNSALLDENFQVIPIETFDDVLKYALV